MKAACEKEDNSSTESKPCLSDIGHKELCPTEFFKKYYTSQHAVCPLQPYQCSLCDKRFIEKYHYEYHMKVHENKRNKFVCKTCDKSFTSRYYLKSHEEIVHHMRNNVTRFNKVYYCRECNKHFVNKSHKDYHDRIHLNKKELCIVCNKEFCSEQYLRKHVLLKHPNEFTTTNGRVVLYDCETCGRKFVSKSSLERHMQAHAGLKPIICEICGKGLRSKAYYLETHRPLCLRKNSFFLLLPPTSSSPTSQPVSTT